MKRPSLNHTYRLIWNELTQAWVVVAEFTRAKGKRSGGVALAAALLVSTSAFALDPNALPTGGKISAGAGSISSTGGGMTITQGSQNLAVNWNTFNIGKDASVTFNQPNSSAIALNRVLGTDGSQILGQLKANGQVWVLNPNGVLFGSGAQVNVGGLVASTLNISDADFLAGKRTFSLPSPASRGGAGGEGSVLNQGDINANYVALLGERVKNEGAIVANRGTVAMAAGNKITLDFNGDKLLGVQIDEGAMHALVENKALVQADGGLVVMTAKAKDALLDTAVNNSGVVRARTIENKNGKILLLGDMQSGTVNVGGTLDASAPSPQPSPTRGEGAETPPGTGVEGAKTPLSLDGRGAGGEGADGGFIETSAAHVKVADDAKITTAAANGQTGTWLIDPVDFTIAAGSGALTTSGIGADTLSTSLGSTSVSIATDASTGGNGDIFVNSAVTWSANTLTLTAHRNINIDANLSGSGTAKLALQFGQASAAGTGAGYSFANGAKVNLPAGANFSTKQGSGGATTNWTVITNLGVEGDASVTPATMSLQGIFTAPGGNYVLGADIDAAATATWNSNGSGGYYGFTPLGLEIFTLPFTGKFDGLGHTVSGICINRNTSVGLFGYTSGMVRNVGVIGGSVTGQDQIGGLAGRNAGTIDNSYSTVTASGNSMIGGLAGYNDGTINNSYSTGAVSGNSSIGGLAGRNDGMIGNSYSTGTASSAGTGVGGLVGDNDVGTISNSYSTGAVSGDSNVGGLVGSNPWGTISNSYSTGAVSGNSSIGGLVGINDTDGTINSSYWDTTTTGKDAASGVGTNNGIFTATGLDTAGMKTLATFSGWDIDDASGTGKIWRIYGDQTYPLLRHFLTPLTVTASNATKTYDGTATGLGVTYSITPNANLLGTALTTAASANVGTWALSASGHYSSQQGYDIAYADGSLTVNQAPLTVTANNAAKTYDGLAYSGGNGVTYSGFVNGETTSVLGGSLAYGGSGQGAVNAGTYAIAASGLTSGNYAMTFADGSLTVNQAPLTVTANNAAKTYDGLAYSGGNGDTYSGFVNGETASVLGGSLAHGGTSQGATNASGYDITASGLTSGNYTITYVNGTLTITPKALTVTGMTAASKIYDGSTSATFSGGALIGLVGSETLSFTSQGAFADQNAGVGKAVTVSSITLADGTGLAGNYSVSAPTGISADITPKILTLTGMTAASKVYDGSTSATFTGGALVGLVGSETLSFTSQGAFADQNAGAGKTVTVSGITLADGTGLAGNYSVSNPTGISADITPKILTLTGVTAKSRIYDGTTAAAIKGKINLANLTGFVGDETVDVSKSGKIGASFADKNVGTGKTVTIDGLAIADGQNGGLASNYLVGAAADITPRNLTVKATGQSKTYDGSTTATVTFSDNRVKGDDLTVTDTSANFVDKNAGKNKKVTVEGIALEGSDAGNYQLANTIAKTKANIATKQLTVVPVIADKVYDGTTTATITSLGLDGLIGAETLTVKAGSAKFDSKDIGDGKTVKVTGIKLTNGTDGELAKNYKINATATGTASITAQ